MTPTSHDQGGHPDHIAALATTLMHNEGVDLIKEHRVGEVLDKAVMESWDLRRRISSSDLAKLLVAHEGVSPGSGRPMIIKLRGFHVIGRIVLDFATEALPFELSDCSIPDGISARSAQLTDVSLLRCHVSSGSLPAVDIQGATLDHDLRLDRSSIDTSASSTPAVLLAEARIAGKLTAKGTRVVSLTGPALDAEQCSIGTFTLLDEGFDARGDTREGLVNLTGGANFVWPSFYSLWAFGESQWPCLRFAACQTTRRSARRQNQRHEQQ